MALVSIKFWDAATQVQLTITQALPKMTVHAFQKSQDALTVMQQISTQAPILAMALASMKSLGVPNKVPQTSTQMLQGTMDLVFILTFLDAPIVPQSISTAVLTKMMAHALPKYLVALSVVPKTTTQRPLSMTAHAHIMSLDAWMLQQLTSTQELRKMMALVKHVSLLHKSQN